MRELAANTLKTLAVLTPLALAIAALVLAIRPY
jgi:hypothetical protein